MTLKENNDLNYSYYFDLSNKDNLEQYFAIKKRDYSDKTIDSNDFIDSINIDEKLLKDIDTIVLAESSSDFILNIVKKTNKNYYILEKNSKDFILGKLKDMNLNKPELASQIRRINNMKDGFKLNKIKSNQRHKYIPYIFKDISIDIWDEVLFVDDSYFTGTTLKAAQEKVKIKNSLFIFG